MGEVCGNWSFECNNGQYLGKGKLRMCMYNLTRVGREMVQILKETKDECHYIKV